MSKPKIINVTFIDPYESNDSRVDLDYIPRQTPESEDYSSLESSSMESTDESCYSIACSEDCSSFGSSQYSLD